MKKWIIWLLCLLLCCTNATPAQATSKNNWKNLYAKYLKKLDPSGKTFPTGKFIDINNDSIPELYLAGGPGVGDYLLTIYKNKVYSYYLDKHGTFSYLKKRNRIYMSGGHMDNYFDYVATLKKGMMVGLGGGCYGANNMKLKVDKKGNLIYRYYWIGKSKKRASEIELYYRDSKHGKKVTKKQYRKKLKKSLGRDRKKYVHAHSGHMKSIRKIRKALNASADRYNLYGNGRFGYFARYPKFFKKSGWQAANGDGIRMAGKGAKLAIWGAYNVIYDTGKSYQKFLRKNKEKMSAVKVSKKSLYYEKKSKKNITFRYAYFVDGGHVGMELTCKKSKKKYFGKIVEKMIKSIRQNKHFK